MQSTSRDHSNTRESIPPFTAPKSGYLSPPPLPSSSISRPSSKRSVFPVPSHETLPSLPRNLRPPISVRQLVLLRLEHGKEGQQPRNSPIDHAGRVTVWINHSITSLNVDQPRAQFVRNLGDGGDLSPWDETQRVGRGKSPINSQYSKFRLRDSILPILPLRYHYINLVGRIVCFDGRLSENQQLDLPSVWPVFVYICILRKFSKQRYWIINLFYMEFCGHIGWFTVFKCENI